MDAHSFVKSMDMMFRVFVICMIFSAFAAPVLLATLLSWLVMHMGHPTVANWVLSIGCLIGSALALSIWRVLGPR